MESTDPKMKVEFNDYSEKKLLDSSTKAFYFVIASGLAFIFLLPFIPAFSSWVFSITRADIKDYSDSIKYTTNLSQNTMIVLIVSVVTSYVLKGKGSARILEGFKALSDLVIAWKTRNIPIPTPTEKTTNVANQKEAKK